jgi:hypothetical protein
MASGANTGRTACISPGWLSCPVLARIWCWANKSRRERLDIRSEGYDPCWSVTACIFAHATCMRSAACIQMHDAPWAKMQIREGLDLLPHNTIMLTSLGRHKAQHAGGKSFLPRVKHESYTLLRGESALQ